MRTFVLVFVIFLSISNVKTQDNVVHPKEIEKEEIQIGGNIFNDFSNDLENSQVMEDERFYRYSRLYSLNLSFGMTTYTGNRGAAYEDLPPSLGLSVTYFTTFNSAFGIGVGYSKHNFVLDGPTVVRNTKSGAGLVEVNMFRTFFFYRHYIDTTNLGTAITFSNPYFTVRMEYWNQTNKFLDVNDIANKSDGTFGAAAGLGLEFPIKIRESYLGLELLYHYVNFPDSYSTRYAPIGSSKSGFKDLYGRPISLMLSYVINW